MYGRPFTFSGSLSTAMPKELKDEGVRKKEVEVGRPSMTQIGGGGYGGGDLKGMRWWRCGSGVR